MTRGAPLAHGDNLLPLVFRDDRLVRASADFLLVHAYREAPPKATDAEAEQLELPKLTAAEKKQIEEEKQEARIWVQGMDKINRARGIHFCLDVSATPFYIAGSGYDEGMPLPWITSDFGLVDAIECGIVKIPRVPVYTNRRA